MEEKDYAGAEDTAEESKEFEYEFADEQTAKRELEFIKLSGRHRLRVGRWSIYEPAEDSKGDPSVIFSLHVIDSEVEEENSVVVDYFAPIVGPRRKDFTKLLLALGLNGRLPKKINAEVLDELIDLECSAVMNAYKVKKGDKKGQWRNSVQDFLYGESGEKLEEYLQR